MPGKVQKKSKRQTVTTKKKKRSKTKPKQAAKKKTRSAAGVANVDDVLRELRRLSNKKTLDGMARFAIPSDKALGVTVGAIRGLAKKLGRNHELAEELWKTDCYEARMLCAFIDEPDKVTPAQMDRWAKDFDNWAICDTICFHLFDKTPHAFTKIRAWAGRKEEFVKRAAFALLASVGVHDKTIADESFAKCLPLIERGASDNRNFVKKGVSWALRVVGRRSKPLHSASVELARKLSESEIAAERWVGKDAYRELTSAKVVAAVKKKK